MHPLSRTRKWCESPIIADLSTSIINSFVINKSKLDTNINLTNSSLALIDEMIKEAYEEDMVMMYDNGQKLFNHFLIDLKDDR